MKTNPIGFFDSGFGGLSLLKTFREMMPNESFIYFGDGQNCPYGSLSNEQITELALRAIQILIDEGCKLIVVACNTATAAAIETLRSTFPEIDIVGMEPAVKPACLLSQSRVVGVLATERSLEGELFQRTAARYSSDVQVIARFGRGFVELVEANEEDTLKAESIVWEALAPIVEAGADYLVLGCTHYPFLAKTISRLAPNLTIIEPSAAVIRRVYDLLQKKDLLAPDNNISQKLFMSFAGEDYILRLSEKAEIR